MKTMNRWVEIHTTAQVETSEREMRELTLDTIKMYYTLYSQCTLKDIIRGVGFSSKEDAQKILDALIEDNLITKYKFKGIYQYKAVEA